MDRICSLQLEGLRQGVYARIVIKAVPIEFTNSFRPENPVIIGTCYSSETCAAVFT